MFGVCVVFAAGGCVVVCLSVLCVFMYSVCVYVVHGVLLCVIYVEELREKSGSPSDLIISSSFFVLAFCRFGYLLEE